MAVSAQQEHLLRNFLNKVAQGKGPHAQEATRIMARIWTTEKTLMDNLVHRVSVSSDGSVGVYEMLLSRAPSKGVSHYRQFAMWLIYRRLDITQARIGDYFHRDRSTVRQAVEKVQRALRPGADPSIYRTIRDAYVARYGPEALQAPQGAL